MASFDIVYPDFYEYFEVDVGPCVVGFNQFNISGFALKNKSKNAVLEAYFIRNLNAAGARIEVEFDGLFRFPEVYRLSNTNVGYRREVVLYAPTNPHFMHEFRNPYQCEVTGANSEYLRVFVTTDTAFDSLKLKFRSTAINNNSQGIPTSGIQVKQKWGLMKEPPTTC